MSGRKAGDERLFRKETAMGQSCPAEKERKAKPESVRPPKINPPGERNSAAGKGESVTKMQIFKRIRQRKNARRTKLPGGKSGRAKPESASPKTRPTGGQNRPAAQRARAASRKSVPPRTKRSGEEKLSRGGGRTKRRNAEEGREKRASKNNAARHKKLPGGPKCSMEKSVKRRLTSRAKRLNGRAFAREKGKPVSKNSGARPFPEPTLPLAVSAMGVTIHKKGAHVRCAEQNGEKRMRLLRIAVDWQFLRAQLPEISARPDRGTDEDEGRCF